MKFSDDPEKQDRLIQLLKGVPGKEDTPAPAAKAEVPKTDLADQQQAVAAVDDLKPRVDGPLKLAPLSQDQVDLMPGMVAYVSGWAIAHQGQKIDISLSQARRSSAAGGIVRIQPGEGILIIVTRVGTGGDL